MASESDKAAPAGWLFGPIPDLMLGCGGLYLCILAALTVGGAPLRAAEAAWLGPLLVLLLGAPHYGATLLRVYEHRNDRRAYAIFSLYATLAIVAVFGLSLFSGVVAKGMVTLYLSWSPWHYTGQNYGIAVMFLRRRGQVLERSTQRWLYASFVFSFVLTILVFHGQGSAPEAEFASGPRNLFVPLGIPSVAIEFLFPLCFAGVLACGAIATVRLLRAGATWSGLAPAAALVALQTVWFSIPFAARHWGILNQVEALQWGQREYFFFWIALGHSVQYLWITAYTARQSGVKPGSSLRRYLPKILLAGMAVWTLPGVLLDPHQMGQSWPQLAALSLLVASAVNLHHFVLDGAIWKLRKGPIADLLIRRVEVTDASADSGNPWLRHAVWGLAAVGCALGFLRYAHEEVLFPRAVAQQNFTAARQVLDRMSWIVSVNPAARAQLDAQEKHQAARRRANDRRLEQRLGIAPDARALLAKVNRALAAEDWSAALRNADAGLGIDAENPELLRAAGQAALELGLHDRARDYLKRAATAEPWDEDTRKLRARLREVSSR